MSNKSKGSHFERAVVKQLRACAGVYQVDRVAGSLGAYDIVANVRGIALYVQCKYRKRGYKSSMTALFAREIAHTEELIATMLSEGLLNAVYFAMVYGHADGYSGLVMQAGGPQNKQWYGHCMCIESLVQSVVDFMLENIDTQHCQKA